MTAAALAWMLVLGAAEAVPPDVRLAVVAGNNRGLDGEQALEFAELDAVRVHAVLTQLGGVAHHRARLVLGGGPEDLVQAVDEMVERARALAPSTRTTLLLYVSAHADEEALHLGGERLPVTALQERVGAAPAHLRVVVVDACRLPVGSRAKGGHPGPEVPVVLDQGVRVDGTVFIAAASPGELAQEWTHLRGSLFTHHLLAGLRGAADFDGDGRVTLAEAYAYAFRITLMRAVAAGLAPQRPSFDFRLAGFGDWVFTRLDARDAELVLADALAGRIWITDQRGNVVAELEKRAGEPLKLAVPPGVYRVACITGTWADAGDVNLAFGGSRRIDKGALVRVRAERALAKGGAPMVLHPWRLLLAWDVVGAGPHGAGAQQGLEVGVERAFGAWSGRLILGGGWSTFEAGGTTIKQQEAHVSATVAWTAPLSPATAAVGLEIRPRVFRQSLTRPAEVEIFGSAPAQTALALCVGPVASATFPVWDRGALGLEVGAGVEWRPNQQGRPTERAYLQSRILAGRSF